MPKPEDYFISVKDNEFYYILNILDHLIEKSKQEGNYPTWGETLDKLQRELRENQGSNVTPWQYNAIIMVLLDYVPEDLKKFSKNDLA